MDKHWTVCGSGFPLYIRPRYIIVAFQSSYLLEKSGVFGSVLAAYMLFSGCAAAEPQTGTWRGSIDIQWIFHDIVPTTEKSPKSNFPRPPHRYVQQLETKRP